MSLAPASVLDFNKLAKGSVKKTSFTYLMAENGVTDTDGHVIRADYADIQKTGCWPLSKLSVEGRFADLISDLHLPQLADILSDKLKLELCYKFRMITVRRQYSNAS